MSDKYQKEIEEILKQAEEILPKEGSTPRSKEPKSSGGSSNLVRRLSGGRRLKISAGKLMLASIALLLLALILGAATNVSVVFLVGAGLVLFVIAYALFFVRPGASSYEKRWRGRVIEDRPTIWERVKRWLKS